MRITYLLAATCAAAVVAGAAPSNAAVLYSFTAYSSFPLGTDNESFHGNFDLITPTFVIPSAQPGTLFHPADLIDCAAVSDKGPATCTDQGFIIGLSGPDTTIGFGVNGVSVNTTIYYYFDAAAFSTPGTYQTLIFGADQAGQLVVTDLGGPAVPEPAIWAMMLVGFGLVGATLRRRPTALA